MKILLTGPTGQVGGELYRSLAVLGQVCAVDRRTCDLRDEPTLRKLIRDYRPSVIVNAAAYTAVDNAEINAQMAHAINTNAVRALGEEAANLRVPIIHYSTDYVFDGIQHRPYKESDSTNPLNTYGRSKLDGELALKASGAKHIILRTSWVYGYRGENFIKTILRLALQEPKLEIVSDQFGAPTSAALLADVTSHIIWRLSNGQHKKPVYGLYHLAAGGVTNWHSYACHIIEKARELGAQLATDKVLPTTTKDSERLAIRPKNSCLDTRKIQNTFGLKLPDWQIGVDHVLYYLLDSTS